MEANEESPLIEREVDEHNAVYKRFTDKQKKGIVTLISISGLTPFLLSGSFIPCIPQIAKDLDTTGSVVSLAVSLSILTNAVGALLWSSYSTYYGRKPIYLISIAIQGVGSLGVGFSGSVPQLLSWRVVQAFGASSGLSVGMGVIGDIYRLEERGTASGVYFAAILFGAAIAPFVGGVTAHYYSWRAMQFLLGAIAVVALLLTALCQPETSQPGARGIDKAKANGEKVGFVLLNPFSSLALLRSPNVFLVSLEGGLVLMTDYFLLVPIASTIGAKYGITNEAAIGAICIPVGLGNCIGAPFSGAISDRVLKKWRKRRGDVWVPEDRLRATLVGAGVLVPCSILFSGLITTYVPGTLGLVLNCACLFMNGLGVDFVLSPSAAYYVDILHSRSAEITAASGSFRSAVISASVVLAIPSVNLLGVVVTDTIVAIIAWIGFGTILLVIRYGERMRAWVDLGFSTAKDN